MDEEKFAKCDVIVDTSRHPYRDSLGFAAYKEEAIKQLKKNAPEVRKETTVQLTVLKSGRVVKAEALVPSHIQEKLHKYLMQTTLKPLTGYKGESFVMSVTFTCGAEFSTRKGDAE